MGNESLGDFIAIQTRTGWGRVLENFASCCDPQPGWMSLDIGSGPGLLAKLMAGYGCDAIGIDLDHKVFSSALLHPVMVLADAFSLPFRDCTFDIVTASNVLFFLPEPLLALQEMTRVLSENGLIALINPSELMSVSAAISLAEQHALDGVARASLIDWANRAENHQRWGEADIDYLFSLAGLSLIDTQLRMGPGLARFAKGIHS